MALLTPSDLSSIRSDENLLRREMESAGVRFKGRNCRCPWHDDKHPSAGIYFKDGVWRFSCQGPCQFTGDIFDVRARMNKTTVVVVLRKEAENRSPILARKPEPEKPTFENVDMMIERLRNVQAVYRYTDPVSGKIDLVIVRIQEGENKSFLQITPAPGGKFWFKAPEGLRPIYNRGRIAKSDTVVIVEGEKCVHALHELGIVATTSPQGSKSADKADWSPVAGKRCILWQDDDKSGTFFIDTVKAELTKLTPPPILYKVSHELLELGEGGDAADLIHRYRDWPKEDCAAAVRDILDDAKSIGVMGDYSQELEEIIAGKRKSHVFFWPHMTNLTRALMPGTVTCFFGPPGSTKSLMMMESLLCWNALGIKACIYELEDTRIYHMRRAHAQMAARSDIADNVWVENNPETMREFLAKHAKELDEIGHCIWDAPDEEISFEMLESWVEARAKSGFEIIVVDPVTAVQSANQVWVADQRFLFKVKTLARKYNTRVILVTHPRKTNKAVTVGLDDMAGGAAYQRFSHSVILIERNDKDEKVRVRINEHFIDEIIPNRIMRIAKSRNGPGAGKRIAFDFDGRSLRFTELGVIEKNANDSI